MNHIIQRAGCNPKHWKIDSELPYCTSAKQYQSITDDYFDSGIYMPPCRSIELFSKSTRGIDPGRWCPVNNPYLDLSFTMDEEMYKEITIVPAYNFQSLVGNADTAKKFHCMIVKSTCSLVLLKILSLS